MQYENLKGALLAFRELFKRKILDTSIIVNKVDFLRLLAAKEASQYEFKEAYELYNYLKPFADKLKLVDFNFSTVQAPSLIFHKAPAATPANHRIIGFNGETYIVRFPMHQRMNDEIRAIPGRMFDGEKRVWTVPLSSTTQLKAFADRNNFEIGDGAHSMFSNIYDNLEQSYSAEHIELNLAVRKNFYGFQTVGVDYAHKNKRIINGDQMGLGKTPQGIGSILINEAFPALVVCPKSLRLNWKDEWEAWTDKKVIILDRNNAKKLPLMIEQGLVDVVITNYDGVQSHFIEEIKEIHITEGVNKGKSYKRIVLNGLEKLFVGGVLDEAHNCRNKATIRFKSVKKCFENMPVRILLTGTPVVKGPQDLAALLDIIGRIDEFGGYYKFIKEFRDMDKKFLSMKDKPLGELSKEERIAATKLKELNIKMRSTCFIRREKHQVLKELPDKFRKIIRVPLDNQQDYDHAWFSLQDFMAKNNVDPKKITQALRAEMLVKYGLLKQLSAKGKLNAVKEFAEQVIESGEKMIIVCWFNETVAWLQNELKQYGAVTISGQTIVNGVSRTTKDEEIQAAKNKFQNDPDTKVIIITYGKGGEGHTLTAASKVAFIELGWTYKDQGQAEDRAHRIGQKSVVECYYFLGANTLDEVFYKVIDSRREVEKQTTGGSEEVETVFAALTEAVLGKRAA